MSGHDSPSNNCLSSLWRRFSTGANTGWKPVPIVLQRAACKRKRTRQLSVLFLMLIAVGCATSRRTWTSPQDPELLDDTAFLHYLATVPIVTVDEGIRAVLLLIGRSTQAATFEERWQILQKFGAATDHWGCSANDLLTKGTLAYLVLELGGIPKGINSAIAGRTGLAVRRYALKDCAHHGIPLGGSPGDPVSGGELISTLSAMESRLADASQANP